MAQGKVIAFSTAVSAGVIEGGNRRYYFYRDQWTSNDVEPAAGLRVQFEPDEATARKIKLVG